MNILIVGYPLDEDISRRLQGLKHQLVKLADTEKGIAPHRLWGLPAMTINYDAVVITDCSLPGIDALIETLRVNCPGTKLVIITADGSAKDIPYGILCHRPILCAMCALPTHVNWIAEDLAKAKTPLKSDEVHACH